MQRNCFVLVVFFLFIWPFCIIDVVFFRCFWHAGIYFGSSHCTYVVYNTNININSSPWYQVHAGSINACPIAVVLPVLSVVAIVVVVVVFAIAVMVAVCMLFFYLANSSRCPQPYIISYVACTFTNNISGRSSRIVYQVVFIYAASTCTASMHHWQSCIVIVVMPQPMVPRGYLTSLFTTRLSVLYGQLVMLLAVVLSGIVCS